MLLLLYPDPKVREQILEDAESAAIPPVQREMFRFAKRFVRASAEMGPADLQRLRDAGLSDSNIVAWATLGSTQSWFTMSGDGGGVSLEGGALTGPGTGKGRESYEASPEGLFAPAGPAADPRLTGDAISWVATDESDPEHVETARWALQRYGFTPNLLKAVSLQSGFHRRHRLALELLERPQSASLTPRHHAMTRALVSQLTRSAYGQVTTRALLERTCPGGEGRDLWEALHGAYPGPDWDPVDRVVLDFAAKVARNAYKVTEKDAQSFREAGLGDEGYVDALNTTSIQIALDRLANCLGVRPDARPILAL